MCQTLPFRLNLKAVVIDAEITMPVQEAAAAAAAVIDVRDVRDPEAVAGNNDNDTKSCRCGGERRRRRIRRGGGGLCHPSGAIGAC